MNTGIHRILFGPANETKNAVAICERVRKGVVSGLFESASQVYCELKNKPPNDTWLYADGSEIACYFGSRQNFIRMMLDDFDRTEDLNIRLLVIVYQSKKRLRPSPDRFPPKSNPFRYAIQYGLWGPVYVPRYDFDGMPIDYFMTPWARRPIHENPEIYTKAEERIKARVRTTPSKQTHAYRAKPVHQPRKVNFRKTRKFVPPPQNNTLGQSALFVQRSHK